MKRSTFIAAASLVAILAASPVLAKDSAHSKHGKAAHERNVKAEKKAKKKAEHHRRHHGKHRHHKNDSKPTYNQ